MDISRWSIVVLLKSGGSRVALYGGTSCVEDHYRNRINRTTRRFEEHESFPTMKLIFIGLYLVNLAKYVKVDETERKIKSLHYRQGPDGLNIDNIISLWNRSVTEETPEKLTTTTVKVQEKVGDTFVERFNQCMRKHKYSKINTQQNIAVVCLKAELMTKLHFLMETPTINIKLFNGYIEFEKLRKIEGKKRYSAKVQSIEKNSTFVPVPLKQSKVGTSHATQYYESYQKLLKELLDRKNGENYSRRKRESEISSRTLEKSARLLESGRKLLSEITNNLENDKEDVEHLKETILDPELVSLLNNFTKNFSIRLNFYPGIAARMTRNENNGVTFDLELDDIAQDATDDEDDTEDDGGRQKKKGKKKKGPKISKKTLKKLFPYLLIPFLIQAALLPFVLKFLLFIAIKALIAGKLALILVAFNAIRNASLKSDEDEYIERMSYDHYGYGNGEEYGAWVNRRTFELNKNNQNHKQSQFHPYDDEMETEEEFTDERYPYRYSRQQKEEKEQKN